jgi:putative metallohydrolase (TIGR04338 family)
VSRDYQQKRVYESEFFLRELFTNAVKSENPVVTIAGITVTLPPEAKFGSVESIRAYVDRVLTHPAVKEAFPWVAPNVAVRRRKGVAKAHYSRLHREIAIPDQVDWAMREVVVLHEVAHHLAPGGHGPAFTDAFLTVLGAVMGPEVALVLRVIYDDNKVDTRPGKRVATAV